MKVDITLLRFDQEIEILVQSHRGQTELSSFLIPDNIDS